MGDYGEGILGSEVRAVGVVGDVGVERFQVLNCTVDFTHAYSVGVVEDLTM